MMFNRLRGSMLAFNMVSVSLVLIAAFTLIYLVIYGNTMQVDEGRLASVSSMFFLPNRPMPNVPPFGEMEMTEGDRFSADYAVSFVLFVRDGKPEYVNSYLDFDNEVYDEAVRQIDNRESGQIRLAGRQWLFRVYPMRPQGGREDFQRIVFLDVSGSFAMLGTLLLTLVCVGAVVLAALFFLCLKFAERAVRPIEEGYNRQRQFVADASHELRTPIASISANLDAIESDPAETVSSQREWFGYIREELKHTDYLINELLYLAKSENVQPENLSPANLSEICTFSCTAHEAVIYEKNLTLLADIEPNIIVNADADKMKQVVYILLDNAEKYTDKGGKIALSLTAVNKHAVLRVTNTAQIAPDDLARIFDRFYRPDSSRSADTGGAGLGLSIAKTIVKRSGGEITAESANSITEFTVRLKNMRGAAKGA